MRYESVKKPRKCPACGSKGIASYLYGMPIFSKKLEKEMETGKTILGGCCISDDDPIWKCLSCETDIYRK